jgi:hypothetical protein
MAPPAAVPRGTLAAAAAAATPGDELRVVAPPPGASPLSRPGRGAWASKTSSDMTTEVGASAAGVMLLAAAATLVPTSRLYVKATREDDPQGLRGIAEDALPYIRVPLGVAGRGVLASL